MADEELDLGDESEQDRDHEPRHRNNVLSFPPVGGERTMDPAE